MSDLFRSALGYLSSSVSQGVSSGGGGGNNGGGAYASASGGLGEEGGGSVGDVLSFNFQGKQRNVKITKLIAEGGFSYVYRGVDVQSGDPVAVKKMLSVDGVSLKGIEEEVGYLGQLSHVNVVQFYGSVVRRVAKGTSEHFLAMEFCPVPLPNPPLRLQHTAQVFAQTCRAIKYLHTFGIVHRDVKLENLLVGVDGMLKLVDFGSCTMEKVYPCAEWSMSRRTIVEEEMASKTTPMYRAPEMLDLWSNHPIDERVDLWALGCLLFALNFGQHPFQDSNKLAILNANYSLPKGVSDSGPVVSVIKGLLRVDPTERISLGGVFEVLQSIAESQRFLLNDPLPFKPVASPVVGGGGAAGRELHSAAAAVGVGVVEGDNSSSSLAGGGIVNPLSGRGVEIGNYSLPQHQQQQQSSGGGVALGGGLLSSLKGGAASLLKNIKEQSQQYLATTTAAAAAAAGPPLTTGTATASAGQQHRPPSRPPPPRATIEFENKEYAEHHQQQPQRRPQQQPTAAAAPPARPAPPKPPPPKKVVEQPRVELEREEEEEASVPVDQVACDELLLDIGGGVTTTAAAVVDPVGMVSNADLLGDLFGGGGGASEDDLFWGRPETTTATTGDLLGDPFGSLLLGSRSAPPAAAGGQFLGGGGGSSQQPVLLLQPSSSSSFQNLKQQQPGLLDTPTTAAGNKGGLPKNSSSPNLSDLILDDLMGGTTTSSSFKSSMFQQQQIPHHQPSTMNKSNPSLNVHQSNKPNYNRSTIFDAGAATSTKQQQQQNLNDVFGEILNSQMGFGGVAGGVSGAGGRTMNDLRRQELLSSGTADPVQLRVSEWREGKKKNIRALLASLHTVTWEECAWEETNMSHMVTPAQVKKTYRKACLAVHPDKQMGRDWEGLAKLIFVELNEAWAAFEDQQQV